MAFKSVAQRRAVMAKLNMSKAAGKANRQGKDYFTYKGDVYHKIDPDMWEPESMYHKR